MQRSTRHYSAPVRWGLFFIILLMALVGASFNDALRGLALGKALPFIVTKTLGKQGFSLNLAGIETSNWHHLRLEKLSLTLRHKADSPAQIKETLIFELDAFELTGSLAGLGWQTLTLESVSAKRLFLNRGFFQDLPKNPRPLRLPHLMINRVKVDQVEIAPELGGLGALSLTAQAILLRPGEISGSTVLKSRTPFERKVTTAFSFWPERQTLTLAGTYTEAASGMIGRLTKLPTPRPMEAQFDLKLSPSAQMGLWAIDIQALHSTYLEEPIHSRGAITLDVPQRALYIDGLSIDFAQRTHHLTGQLSPEAQSLKLALQQLPLTALKAWWQAPETISDATLSGTVDWQRANDLLRPQLTSVITVTRPVKYNTWLPETATITSRLSLLPGALQVDALSFATQCLAFNATGTLTVGAPATHSALSINQGLGRTQAQATITLPETRLDCMEQLAPPNLKAQITAHLMRGLGTLGVKETALRGNLKGQVKLNGPLNNLASQMLMTFTGALGDSPAAAAIALTGHPHKLTAERFSLGLGALLSLQGTAQWEKNAASQWQITLKETRISLPTLNLSGTLNSELDRQNGKTPYRLSTHFIGYLNERPLSMQINVSGQVGQIELERFLVSTGPEKSALLKGQYKNGNITASATFEKFLSPLPIQHPLVGELGALNGEIHLKGDRLRPELQANLTANFTPHFVPKTQQPVPKAQQVLPKTTPAVPNQSPLIDPFRQLVDLNIDTQETHFSGELTFSQGGEPWAKLAADFPRTGLLPPYFIDQQQSLGMSVWVNLARTAHWFIGSGEALQGELVLDLQVPSLARINEASGFLRLTQGAYEDTALGLSLKKMSLQAQRTPEKPVITLTGTAQDDTKGTYVLNGTLPWPLHAADPQKAQVSLNKTHFAYYDAVQGQASGIVDISGNLEKITLSGNIILPKLLIALESLKDERIPEVNVKPQTPSPEQSKTTQGSLRPPIVLDMTLQAPKQAFLRGKGLEAELSGTLHLSGTLQTPVLRGQLALVRGHYKILGRKFTIQESNIQIDGNNLRYTITALNQRDGTTISVRITGTQESLALQFSADPTMPEDDIIAFLLFGKTLERISPAQVLQVAAAIDQIRPKSAGANFDPLGKTREWVHVDTLTLDTATRSDTGGVDIGVGKYLNDRVFLEFIKGTNDINAWQTNLEIELAPSLNLKTHAQSGRGMNGLELLWYRDY